MAIVTGAGSPIGIGHAITLGFVRVGARLAMFDLNQSWLEQSVREAKAIGGEDCALAIVADVTDPDAVEQAVRRTIVEFGRLHILVNNAGTDPRAAGLAPVSRDHLTNFWPISPEGWNGWWP